ncbi:hypothetical protein FA95DRAFT_1554227 [Auriscalpium vulgare]|uniref:Uncharacterized protein n=1 Tax=Auriscalpium vulgare TaxID=40419 RepID=A0ACB8S7C7_9AGAM|nr:hypothetical protein FA95DRAFT_1554227 [Auriscalpium vulgare]
MSVPALGASRDGVLLRDCSKKDSSAEALRRVLRTRQAVGLIAFDADEYGNSIPSVCTRRLSPRLPRHMFKKQERQLSPSARHRRAFYNPCVLPGQRVPTCRKGLGRCEVPAPHEHRRCSPPVRVCQCACRPKTFCDVGGFYAERIIFAALVLA